ncbi:tRNA (32-2'-O)-methyltransferase regulator THADA [Battus philenor]|uniref:tRNA (32-2'-O)-methyltransferase regulator THADA n=1 Tax=Battus philenor TaxID=42288 RepID=UPI0035CF66B7
MEDLNYILLSLQVPTSHLNSNTLQEVLLKIKKVNGKSSDCCEHSELSNNILQALWSHLLQQLNEFDEQLLCSICFYTVLSATKKQESFLHSILNNIKENFNNSDTVNGENSTKTISIIYGIFQSNFLRQRDYEFIYILEDILQYAVSLLIQMAYEYSHYTFIVFKILGSLKKVLGTELQNVVFTRNNQIKLLNLVNHNWENPINGIRNLNKLIFQNILSAVENNVFEEILEEIDAFYWNKAKYLMFAEIIDQYKGNIMILLKRCDLINGLLNSLSKPGLVSAGADMYYCVLKKMKSDEEWKGIFLNEITQILYQSPQVVTENFNNYWCLTTLKKFPSLSTSLINMLQEYPKTESRLFSTLCVMRQSNKLNLIEKQWKKFTFVEHLVLYSIEHCNYYIRICAFDIVCVTNSKSWPSEIEYHTVINYLSDNVSSDCTVLRLNMLNSFSSFLRHIHILHLNNTNMSESEKSDLLSFCEKLQHFIIMSLNLNGNYQRKITTIKIADTVLNCFTEIPKKRQKQVKQNNSFIQYIADNGVWIFYSEEFVNKLISILSDPADDIRENLSLLLLNHYATQLAQPVIINKIIERAILKIQSKFFYEIDCGRSMFQLVIDLLLKDGSQEGMIFNSLETIFTFAYSELITEFNLKREIVESIEQGKQMHSNLGILCAIYEACLKTSYKLQISDHTAFSILEILEELSNQFVWEPDLCTSSDFSKMNDMVLQIIQKSGHATNNEDNEKITGLQQIILNCLWLNVKVSCELAALMIEYYNDDTYLNVCVKSLNVITKVLETSRHKGAIEAAGVSLGQGIRKLTSLPVKSELSELPLALLKRKLKELISEANDMASVTRRGAGLSIMIHRIVSNDTKKNKPLFHHFINTLLNCCNICHDDPKNVTNPADINCEKDLPKAIYIHFLTRIVTDSSLTTEVMYYSAKLAELAFDNLTSPHWQIRNAALQLYGALIPKLMGQKKVSGLEETVISTVACDEFRTHFPQLWEFILDQLKSQVDEKKDLLQTHSNLLPILNILGNFAKRYNFKYNSHDQLDPYKELLKSLSLLLQSAIYTVRRLTSKCIYNMYSFDDIFALLSKVEQPNENFLHGCLLLLVDCNKNYNHLYKTRLNFLNMKFKSILEKPYHSYLCKELIENVFTDKLQNFSDIKQIVLKTKTGNEPGLFQWARTHISKCLQNCSWADIPEYLNFILDNSDYERYCEVLHTRLDLETDIDNLILITISKILLSFSKKAYSVSIWKILYKISTLINFKLEIYTDIKDIIKYIDNDYVSYRLRYIIPFLARVATDDEIILFVTKLIRKMCNIEISDIDMRLISAAANNEIASRFKSLPDVIKINSIITVVILLQDEDEEIRNLSVMFYENVTKTGIALHPYLCLRRILDTKFLHSVLCEPVNSVQTICEILLDVLSSTSFETYDEFNPFANENKNIYQEKEVVNQLINRLNDDLK